MKLLKRTYTLPPQTVGEFEQAIAPGERSAVLARILSSWLAERRRSELRAGVEEGCRVMWDDYAEIEREFHPLEEEVDRKHGGDA